MNPLATCRYCYNNTIELLMCISTLDLRFGFDCLYTTIIVRLVAATFNFPLHLAFNLCHLRMA